MKDLYTWACCSGASVFSMYPVLIYTLQYLASRISCVDFLVQFLDIFILVSWPIEDQLSHSLVDPSTGGDSFGVNPLPPLVIQSVSNIYIILRFLEIFILILGGFFVSSAVPFAGSLIHFQVFEVFSTFIKIYRRGAKLRPSFCGDITLC